MALLVVVSLQLIAVVGMVIVEEKDEVPGQRVL